MELTALQNFSWAHRGVQIEEFKEGQMIITEDADMIAVSTHEGWAAEAGTEKAQPAPRKKAHQRTKTPVPHRKTSKGYRPWRQPSNISALRMHGRNSR